MGTGSGSDGVAAVAPVLPPEVPPEEDPAYQKLAAARAQIASGKKTFAAVATELSEDAPTKNKGGLVGWCKVEAPTFGAASLNDAVKTLEDGKVSEILVTNSGFFLLTVDGKREGDLSFEQVSERCPQLAESRKMRPNLRLLQENDDNGKPLPVTYQFGKILKQTGN